MKSNYELASRSYDLGTETAFTVLAKANKLASEGKNIITLPPGTIIILSGEIFWLYLFLMSLETACLRFGIPVDCV